MGRSRRPWSPTRHPPCTRAKLEPILSLAAGPTVSQARLDLLPNSSSAPTGRDRLARLLEVRSTFYRTQAEHSSHWIRPFSLSIPPRKKRCGSGGSTGEVGSQSPLLSGTSIGYDPIGFLIHPNCI
jgi:hypothetical protein